jgi:hypothetical protein
MTVDALALGEPNLRNIDEDFSQVGIDYTQLRNTLDPVPSPAPFQLAGGLGTPQEGVELHWTVPTGLRSGHSTEQGVDFPLLPNRWLVVRTVTPDNAEPGTAPTLSAWLLQSDKEDLTDAQSPWPDPQSSVKYTFIGVATELSSAMEDAPSTVKRLYSMAPGAPAFAVTYQSARNVLAFYDPMTDVPNGDVSYSVIGFFNPTDWDPLLGVSSSEPNGFTTQDGWQNQLDELKMQVGDGTAQALSEAQAAWQAWSIANGVDPSHLPTAQQNLPGQLLPFGAVQKLTWKGTQFFYENNNIPPSGEVPVAIGNTPSEALGAWLGEQISSPGVQGYSIERLILALMTDSITTFMTNVVGFEFSTAGLTFGSSAGGSETVVTLPVSKETSQTKIPLDDAQTAALATLNAAETARDHLSDALQSRRWELFSAQWKLVRKPGDSIIVDAIKVLTAQVNTLISDLAAATQTVDHNLATLENLLGADYVASAQPLDQYQEANDPVILVASLQVDDKIVERSLLVRDLDCRISGQTLTGFSLTVDGTGPTEVTTAELAAGLNLSFLSNANIPLEAKDILLESLMLDPGLIAWLATLWLKQAGGGPSFADVEKAIVNLQAAVKAVPGLDDTLSVQLMADVSGFQGVAPDPLANQDWEQPWTPIYIAWQGDWHPTSTKPSGALDDWQLGEIDFEWDSASRQVSDNPIIYQGRTLLNSDAPTVLAVRIQALLKTPDLQIPDFVRKDLQEISVLLVQSDIVIQSLSGLSDAMIQREEAQAEGNQDEGETPDSAIVPNPPLDGHPAFLPIRSGHLALSRLWVLDAWGQTFKGELPGGHVVPIRSESMVTPGDNNEIYAQLPPRLAQPARIDFNLIKADAKPGTPSNSADSSSPICGFIAADQLSGGLLVFDNTGNVQGTLLPIVRDDSSTGVRWEAAPGLNFPLGSAPELDNDHLLAMIEGILAQTANGVDALGELLDLMDGVSQFINPNGDLNGNFSILIGRPLAVVRASVELQLDGDPVYDQAFDNTGKQVTDGYTKVTFPLRVGDIALPASGVTGYYLDDNYDSINGVYGYTPVASSLRRALYQDPDALAAAARQIPDTMSAGATLEYVKLDSLVEVTPSLNTQFLGTGITPPQTTPRMLTVLMEPSAELPVIMGYLPVQSRRLPPGPVDTALANLQYLTRTGPLLVQPDNIRMPLPADIKGTWDYVWRDSVTTWSDSGVSNQDAQATLIPQPLQLYWGWMRLSGAFSTKPENMSLSTITPHMEFLMNRSNTATAKVPDLNYILSPAAVLVNQTMPIEIQVGNASGGDIAVGFDFKITIILSVGVTESDLVAIGRQTEISVAVIDQHWTQTVASSASQVVITLASIRPFTWESDDPFTVVISEVVVNPVISAVGAKITAQASDGPDEGTMRTLDLPKITSGLTISAFANPPKVGGFTSTDIFWTATGGAKVELTSNQPTQSTNLDGPGPVFSGKFSVQPNQDVPQTLYTVEVQTAGNTQRVSTLVVVNLLPPQVDSFTAKSTTDLDFLKTVDLFWSTTYTLSAALTPGGSVPINSFTGYAYTPSEFMTGNEESLTINLTAGTPRQPSGHGKPLTLHFAPAEIVYFSYATMDPDDGISIPLVKNANPPNFSNLGEVWTLIVTGPGGPLERTIGADVPEVRYFGPANSTVKDGAKITLNYWVNDFKQGDVLTLAPSGQTLTPDADGKGSVEVTVTATTDYTLEATLSGIQINNTVSVIVSGTTTKESC